MPELYVTHPNYFRNNLASFEHLIRGLSITKAMREYKRDYLSNPTTRSWRRLQTLAVLAAKEANQ
jgi:hypothetical protein